MMQNYLSVNFDLPIAHQIDTLFLAKGVAFQNLVNKYQSI